MTDKERWLKNTGLSVGNQVIIVDFDVANRWRREHSENVFTMGELESEFYNGDVRIVSTNPQRFPSNAIQIRVERPILTRYVPFWCLIRAS